MHCIVKENLDLDLHYEQIGESTEISDFMTSSQASAEDTGVWKQGL